MRIVIAFATMLMLSAGLFGGSQTVSAQQDETSCSAFDSLESAQEYFDGLASDDPVRDRLDSDGDGKACEDASHLIECSEFVNQGEAQAYVNGWAEGSTFPTLEDEDGDGLYCEAYFGTEADDEPETGDGIHVNLIACEDEACIDAVSIADAVVTTYYKNGEFADTCTTYIAEDFDGCTLLIPASGGDVRFDLPADYAGYEQVSVNPTIFEGREGAGPIYVYYFRPAGQETEDGDDNEADADSGGESADADAGNTVNSLPSTGSGVSTNTMPLIATMTVAIGALVAAMAMRLRST